MSSQITSLLILAISTSLLLSGCSDKNSQATFSPDSGAHLAGWKTDHKTFARSNLEICVPCHGENLDGGISKVSCTQCHLGSQSVAHPLQWGSYAYARHADYVGTNGTSSCANAACHGTSLAGTGSIPSCTACHSKNGDKYSKHPAAWQKPLLDHAAYLKQYGVAINTVAGSGLYPSCGTSKCHGTDLKGVFLSGTSCYLCHTETTQAGAISKHPASWTSALSSHASYVAAKGNTSCGTTVCHGLDLKGVTGSGPSCTKCHVGAYSKHPAGWGGYTKQGVPSHGLYVKASGTAGCTTSLCHGTDAKGVSGSGSSCYSCHESPTSEHRLTWTTSPLRDHGSYVKSNGYSSCATAVCHGANSTGVLGSGTSCFSCHAAGPSSKHPTTWSKSTLADHSSYVKTNGYTSCATSYCHGTDAQGGTGGSTAPSCYACHPAGPTDKHPLKSWGAAPYYYDHISYKQSHTTYKCSTTLCHPGGHFVTGGDNTACKSCHTN